MFATQPSPFYLLFIYFTDDVQSLGLWSDGGRVKFSWLHTVEGENSHQPRHTIRVIEPGQNVFCAKVCVSLRIFLKQELLNVT